MRTGRELSASDEERGLQAGRITPEWSVPARVRCAFTLRTGGISVAPYDSLNLGTHVNDVADAVRENRRRVRESLRLPAEPVWLQQVHGTEVADLDVLGPSPPSPPHADAAVTRAAGRVCVIQVADCMPVLFAARDGSAVGAAHAGWRGLAGGVLEQTVRALGVAPTDLVAWLGPTISQQHFEVGDDVRSAFMSGDPDASSAFVANTRGRWQCDLYRLARRRLATLGVNEVFGAGWCTYAEGARFFSFRRDGQCGRMAALIWLE
jgi:purine-nucleoside/S-methyl-5'-thioadenosine phosphorylase / adenosine deaminase